MLTWNDRRWGLLLLGTLVFARTIGGRLPHMLFYLVAAYLVLSYVVLRHSLNNITCLQQPERRATREKASISMRLRLYNESFLPVSWLEITDMSPSNPSRFSTATSLGVLSSRVLNYEFPALKRGRYNLGPLNLRLTDPVGAISVETLKPGGGVLTVFAKPAVIPYFPLPLRQPHGVTTRSERTYEEHTSVAGLREFVPGDNPKHIHWKVTARLEKPVVRQFHLVAGADIYILLDMQSPQPLAAHDEEADPEWADRVVEIGVSVAAYALSKGYTVAIWAEGQQRYRLPAGRGSRQLMEILDLSASLRAGQGMGLAKMIDAEAPAIAKKATCVAVSHHFDERTKHALLTLSHTGHPVVFVYAPKCESDSAASLEDHFRQGSVHLVSVPFGTSVEQALSSLGQVRQSG